MVLDYFQTYDFTSYLEKFNYCSQRYYVLYDNGDLKAGAIIYTLPIGLDLVLYQKIKEALNRHKIFSSEACYILESNYQMNSILKKIDGKCVKKYRIFQIKLK